MKVVDETAQAWQRIKVALTGLAAVVVMIGSASLVFGAVHRERAPAAAGEPRPAAVANLSAANSTDPAEPLAELGVSPSAQANGASPAAR
jgi:hypothetical protein